MTYQSQWRYPMLGTYIAVVVLFAVVCGVIGYVVDIQTTVE